MQINIFKKLLILTVLVNLITLLHAEDKRSIPLDIYLIIDGSTALKNAKNDAVSWINRQLVDRVLMEGDRITVWSAGDRAQIIYSDTISASSAKDALRDKIQTIAAEGKTADFSSALRDASSRVSQTPGNRLAYTVLVTASAEGMEPALSGSAQNLFRWFRSEKYERWQVLVVAPDIAGKVRQNAQAYMRTAR